MDLKKDFKHLYDAYVKHAIKKSLFYSLIISFTALFITSLGNVAYLAEGMFQNCTALTAMEIPASVYRLGGAATTTNTTSNFAGYVFDGCTNLATITMNDTAIAIGSYTFRNCTSLTTFTFPNTVNNLGEHMFDGCTSLKTVTLSNICTYMAQYMFYNCTSLESVSMPEAVNRVGGTYSSTVNNRKCIRNS